MLVFAVFVLAAAVVTHEVEVDVLLVVVVEVALVALAITAGIVAQAIVVVDVAFALVSVGFFASVTLWRAVFTTVIDSDASAFGAPAFEGVALSALTNSSCNLFAAMETLLFCWPVVHET